jgi:type VI protein secretion system component Hcp
LKISGIDGESNDAQFPKWIQITPMSWGAASAWAATDAGSGKVSLQDVNVATLVNTAGATPQVFLRYEIFNVTISKDQISGGTGKDHPMESSSYNFDRMEVQYGAEDENGKVNTLDQTSSYDLKDMRAS